MFHKFFHYVIFSETLPVVIGYLWLRDFVPSMQYVLMVSMLLWWLYEGIMKSESKRPVCFFRSGLATRLTDL